MNGNTTVTFFLNWYESKLLGCFEKIVKDRFQGAVHVCSHWL